jgi:hypothetical protein
VFPRHKRSIIVMGIVGIITIIITILIITGITIGMVTDITGIEDGID